MSLLLDVQNLSTSFFTDEGVVPAVQDVSFHIDEAETLGLVGESGCGKSVTAMSILRLIPQPPGKIVNGKMLFEGTDLVTLSENKMRDIRGDKISMIFQEPMTSLNPVYTIGYQIVEAIEQHRNVDEEESKEIAIEMLAKVGIPSPEQRFNEYPHQISGGMRQRAMIAMALVCRPSLLIADEPTTALDVTIQAQILDLLRDLQSELKMSIMMITHDLGIIAEMAHRVVVMYASRIVEMGDVNTIFKHKSHPYTKGLFNAIPNIDLDQKRLYDIPGMVPSPRHFPKGCKFHPRCPYAMDICKEEEPKLKEIDRNHFSACWLNETGER